MNSLINSPDGLSLVIVRKTKNFLYTKICFEDSLVGICHFDNVSGCTKSGS